MFQKFNNDVILHLLSMLPIKSLIRLSSTCKRFYNLSISFNGPWAAQFKRISSSKVPSHLTYPLRVHVSIFHAWSCIRQPKSVSHIIVPVNFVKVTNSGPTFNPSSNSKIIYYNPIRKSYDLFISPWIMKNGEMFIDGLTALKRNPMRFLYDPRTNIIKISTVKSQPALIDCIPHSDLCFDASEHVASIERRFWKWGDDLMKTVLELDPAIDLTQLVSDSTVTVLGTDGTWLVFVIIAPSESPSHGKRVIRTYKRNSENKYTFVWTLDIDVKMNVHVQRGKVLFYPRLFTGLGGMHLHDISNGVRISSRELPDSFVNDIQFGHLFFLLRNELDHMSVYSWEDLSPLLVDFDLINLVRAREAEFSLSLTESGSHLIITNEESILVYNVLTQKAGVYETSYEAERERRKVYDIDRKVNWFQAWQITEEEHDGSFENSIHVQNVFVDISL
jgi:hypothetical protein